MQFFCGVVLGSMEIHNDWFLSIMISVTVLLQMKMNVVWSEARMFRKLVRRLKMGGKTQIRTEALSTFPYQECNNDQLFARMYIMMSKGRHSTASRVYSYLLLWTLWVLDILQSVGSIDSIVFIESEALTVLRLMLAMGALIVVGALRYRQKTIVAVIIACSVPYVWSYTFFQNVVLYKSDVWESSFPYKIFYYVNLLRLIAVGAGLLYSLFPCVWDYLGKGTHISNIAYSIEEGLTDDSLRKSQVRRLQLVRERNKVIHRDNPSSSNDLLVADSQFFSLPFKSAIEVIVSVIILTTNAFLLGDLSRGRFAIVVIVEFFEFVGTSLLFVNDVIIEPALFAALIDVADKEL